MAFIPRARSVRRGCLALIGAVACQLLLFVGILPVYGQTTDTSTELKRPAYQWLRFNEDWSVLRGKDLSRTDDFWDRVKFIPLSPDGSVYFSLGGQARERAEYFNKFFFGDSKPASDAYLLTRLRLSGDLHVTEYFRAFVEGRSSFATDRDLSVLAENGFESKFTLLNAFGDIKIPFGDKDSLTVRGGRFEMIYGSQRLISAQDYTNIQRTFDGGLGILQIAGWTITPFWTIPVIADVDITNMPFNRVSPHQSLFGIFATNAAEYYPPFPLPAPLPRLPFNLDLYWFGVNNEVATFNGTTGREERQTLGGRVFGKLAATGLDYELEGAGQFGSIGNRNIAAGMATAVLGYTLPVLQQLAPRVYVEFDYASGDGRRGGNVGTYNQLFPNAHIFLGYMDYIGRQNIISGNGGVSVTPLKDLSVSLQHYFFWRASDRDALYNKAGGILRPGDTTTDRYVGAETDLLVNYSFTRHFLGYAGYSHFFPGDFIRDTGKHSQSDFLYAAFQYTF